MKSKLTVLAIALFILAQTASAQQSRDNKNDHRGRGAQQSSYNNNRDLSYGTKPVRNNSRNKAIMPDRAFKQALISIRQERFDSDKIKLAKLLVSRNNMTTVQIRTLAQLFSFDSSKLEFTKYAYASCADQQNYYQIGRIFSFSSSRQELYNYLARV